MEIADTSDIENCKHKLVYYKKKEALKDVKEITGKTGQKVYFYQCPCCGWYHISHSNKKVKKYEIKSIGMIFIA